MSLSLVFGGDQEKQLEPWASRTSRTSRTSSGSWDEGGLASGG